MPQKLLCQVAQVLSHGEQVYSLLLAPTRPAPRFFPGQFLHLALDEYNHGDFWPDSRVFSIASSPAERDLLRITYAVKGRFTARMEAELKPGAQVWVKLPYGEFTIDSSRPVCLLAGGTGVTAFTAFLADLGKEHPLPVYLFYGARYPDLLIYRTLIETVVAKCSSLRAFFIVEQGQWPGCLPGRLNLDHVWQVIPKPQEVLYYLSGSPVMLKDFSTALLGRGINASCILKDAWE